MLWLEGAYDVILSLLEMDMVNQVLILNKAVCISHSANTQ